MKESFYKVKAEDAVRILERAIDALKEVKREIEESDEEYIGMTCINYDEGILCSPMKMITAMTGVALIEDAKTIFYNEDPLFPHLDLHSIEQPDKRELLRKGTVKSLLFLNGR